MTLKVPLCSLVFFTDSTLSGYMHSGIQDKDISLYCGGGRGGLSPSSLSKIPGCVRLSDGYVSSHARHGHTKAYPAVLDLEPAKNTHVNRYALEND